jgi:V8-like Glu-specific endopeptidase
MTPWFEDLPLDFTREETRTAEQLLITAYPMNLAALTLAQNAGLNLAALNQGAQVTFLVRDILVKARASNRLTTLIAEVLSDPGQEAVHERFRQLVAGHEASIADAGMNRKPSLATLAALPSTVEVWARGSNSPEPLAGPGLEATINAAAGFADPAVLRLRLAEAEVRTARIEIGGKPKGTGFLVGDDLLITAWHVVASGVMGAVARFDHSVFTASGNGGGRPVAFAAEWEVTSSAHEPVPVEIGPDGPPAGTWDFALVRLAAPVGAQAIGPNPDDASAEKRGSYVLDGSPYAFEEAESIFILGHPEGRPVQLSWASPAQAKETMNGNRVRYQTNTEGGSSGSPVFNRDWRVVALHHAAGPTSIPGEFNLQHGEFNQGVPISGIVAELKRKLAGRPELAELGLE